MHLSLLVQELQTSCYRKHDCSSKDARRPKFRGRNRYADVSPCTFVTVYMIALVWYVRNMQIYFKSICTSKSALLQL